MRSMVEKLRLEKDTVMQWHTQAVNITTNLKVKVYFTSPALIVTNTVTWNFHVHDSAKVRYDMILGRDLLTELVFNLEIFKHFIKEDYEPLKGSTAPMVDLGIYILRFKKGDIKPEE